MNKSKNMPRKKQVTSKWSIKIVHIDGLSTFYVDQYRDGVLIKSYNTDTIETIGDEFGRRINGTLSKVLKSKYTQLDMTFELKL